MEHLGAVGIMGETAVQREVSGCLHRRKIKLFTVFKIPVLTFSYYNQMKKFSASMNIKYNETYSGTYKGH